MEIEQAVYERLAADATLISLAVTARWGGAAATDPLPLLLYERTAREPLRTLDGDSLTAGKVSIHFEAYADDPAVAAAVARAAKASLQSDAWTASTDATRSILCVLIDSEADGLDPPTHSEELGTWRVDLDLSIDFK